MPLAISRPCSKKMSRDAAAGLADASISKKGMPNENLCPRTDGAVQPRGHRAITPPEKRDIREAAKPPTAGGFGERGQAVFQAKTRTRRTAPRRWDRGQKGKWAKVSDIPSGIALEQKSAHTLSGRASFIRLLVSEKRSRDARIVGPPLAEDFATVTTDFGSARPRRRCALPLVLWLPGLFGTRVKNPPVDMLGSASSAPWEDTRQHRAGPQDHGSARAGSFNRRRSKDGIGGAAWLDGQHSAVPPNLALANGPRH